MGKTVSNPKNYIISCRVDQSELDLLQEIAKQSNTNISTLLRNTLALIKDDPAGAFRMSA